MCQIVVAVVVGRAKGKQVFSVGCCVSMQLQHLTVLTYLLATQGHLGGHHSLAFGNQCALGAHAVLPPAVSLVALLRL